MSGKNEIIMEFSSNSENESLARTVISAFVARLDPTLEELADIKTAVSELDRSGMGFAFMEAFMDELDVQSELGKGTTIRMKKTIYSAIHIS